MKSIKRLPLAGKICGLIIFLLICTILYFNNTQTTLKKVNNTLTTTINEQTSTIENLNAEKSDLATQLLQLEEENKTLKAKNDQPKKTQPVKQTTAEPVVNTTETNAQLGQFKITAYCNCSSCCGKWAGGPTASGTMPQAGRTIAVDPKVIPLGSKVVIDGHTYVAEDTGGAIKGNKIDMYFNTHSEAMAWGVKYKDVQVIQ